MAKRCHGYFISVIKFSGIKLTVFASPNRRSICLVKGLRFINVISVTNDALLKREAIAGNINFNHVVVVACCSPSGTQKVFLSKTA